MPVPKALPPVEFANHDIVPDEAEAVKVTVPVPLLEPGVVPVIVGVEFRVTLAVFPVVMVFVQMLGDTPLERLVI